MTYNQAVNKARRLAKARKEEMFVVFESPEDGYEVGNEFDLETFYYGARVDAMIDPDDEVLDFTW